MKSSTTKKWTFYHWQYETGQIRPCDGFITDTTDTTSGQNSLGLSYSGSYGRFLPGDLMTILSQPDDPKYAIGMMIVTSPFAPAGVIQLSIPGGSIGIAAMPNAILPDGREAHFVGLLSDTPFFSSTVS